MCPCGPVLELHESNMFLFLESLQKRSKCAAHAQHFNRPSLQPRDRPRPQPRDLSAPAPPVPSRHAAVTASVSRGHTSSRLRLKAESRPPRSPDPPLLLARVSSAPVLAFGRRTALILLLYSLRRGANDWPRFVVVGGIRLSAMRRRCSRTR